MSDFERYRLAPHEEWARLVFEHITQRGWSVVPMGAQVLAPQVAAMLSAMEQPDPTAAFVRYMPDGFAVHLGKQTTFFFDAKVGKTIEKAAYIVYQAFAGEDRAVFVCLKHRECVYWVPIRDLAFLDSQVYVGRFPEQRRMPVDDEGWIAPRLWPRWKYLEWKQQHPEASGTPFRYFDFPAMTKWLYLGFAGCSQENQA